MKRQRTDEQQQNDVYFSGYNNVDVHRLMLADQSRTGAYSKAIQQNEHLFRNKVVMDVGSGSGILALMAARAGARRVYAVEASDMARTIRLTARENGYGDVIQVISGRIEEISLLLREDGGEGGGEEGGGEGEEGERVVDVIVSEWMAIFLVQEGMLPSVLYARDHFLKRNGALFPSSARLYVQPGNLMARRQRELSLWDNVEGKLECVRKEDFLVL